MRLARPSLALAVLAVLAVAGAAFLLSSFWLFLATSAAISAIVARSVGIVTGQTGMISLCQLSFAAVGAWVVARLNLHGVPVPFLLQILIGGVAALPFGILIGLPALRLRGINLAVVTLGFAVAADIYLSRKGFPGIDTLTSVRPPAPLDEPRAYFLLCWGAFVLVSSLLAVAGRSRVGSAWLAVSHSERATGAMGLSVARTKLTAFAVSAFVAGLSGGLLAGQVGLLTPQNFAPLGSLVTFAVAVMVGAQYAEGAALAGVLTAFLPELLRRLSLPLDVADFVFGLGAVDVLRRGHGGIAAQGRDKLERRRLKGALALAGARPAGRLPPPSADRGVDAAPASLVGARLVRARPGGQPALAVRGLTVRFGEVVALDAVDLTVEPGIVSALIGPNGAGKSTLVDAVTGFIPRYEGSIMVDGVPLDGLPVHRRVRSGVRRTFQQDRTVPNLTVGQYVRLAAGHHLRAAEVAEALEFLDCPAADYPISAVDVGSRRLVEVAGALAARPKVLLLDEPAAGLAEAESSLLARRIADVPGRFGCAVLLIEHDMGHVQAASSVVTVLDFGQVIAAGPPRDVLDHRTVVAAYLGEEVAV